MAQRDPFYAVKDEVIAIVASLKTDSTRLENAVNATDINSLSKVITNKVEDVKLKLNDLQQTIKIVEDNRSRFPMISDAELGNRQKFVNETRNTLNDVSETTSRIQRKATSDQKRSLLAPRDDKQTNSRFTASIDNETKRGGDNYVRGQQSQQQLIEAEQDNVLDSMSSALSRLQNISNDINVDLKEQDHMLTEFDTEIDEAQNNMNVVLKKIDKILKSSDKGRLCCILVLFITAIALLFAIIYT